MNTNKFTHKTNEVIAAAHELAMNGGHVQFMPLYLAMALISDHNVIFRQAIVNAIGSDTHLAVDHLILGFFEDSQIGDLLKEAGVSVSRVKTKAEKLRGKEGRKVESAFGDTTFQALKTYGRDLIQRVIRIPSSRTKNNPILIGEPGVGKTAVVEGLAQRIVRGDVPSNLVDVRLIALDMGALVTRPKYRGEVEEWFKAVLVTTQTRSMDTANLFKPMLTRGQLRCIGATTLDEYGKYVEKDVAFERQFQQVYVAEPSSTDTISILRRLKEMYEGHHGVQIQDRALVVILTMHFFSLFYSGHHLPDKAIDLVDEACENVRVQLDSQPKEIDKLERKRIQVEVELHALEKEKDKAIQKGERKD
ncbi:hypothetical protein CsSME_00006694 [Camellia sinensis var. sinensis]